MSKGIYWVYLAGAIGFEVAGTSIMKASQESWPVMGMLMMYAFLFLSYFCLAKAVVKLPIGVAYAFWEGFGLLLITLVSVVFLKEKMNWVRGAGLALVVIGTLLVHHGTEDSEDDVAKAPTDEETLHAQEAPGGKS